MKKLLSLCLLAGTLLIFSNNVNAQSYNNAIGVRVGNYNGLNFKTFVQANKAIDLNLAIRSNDDVKSFLFTGLYQVHNPIGGAPGLQWYYGGGASIGSWKVRNFDGDVFLSADGVLGLDYKIQGAPLNFAIDWRPRLEITPDTDFRTNDVGLAIRFTF